MFVMCPETELLKGPARKELSALDKHLRPRTSTATPNAGFTVVELVVVIVLLAILSVYAVPRFVGVASFERSGFYQETVSAARYAKRLAMGRGDKVRIRFSANGYKLFYRENSQSFAALPERGHPVSSANRDDIRISSGASLPHNATFNALGRCERGCKGGLDITVGGKKMTIHEETGYVDTSP